MNIMESKGFSHTEWSILDYYSTEAIHQALKLNSTTNPKERVLVIEEACKYVRDIEGFLINRSMNDLFLLSRYTTHFSTGSLQRRVFLRVVLSGISQIIFQEEKCLEETFKMLSSVADIYLPCLLTQQSLDMNTSKFILGLKTQLVIFGTRCGEDHSCLIDRYLKWKKQVLPNLTGILMDSQLKKVHKRQVKSRHVEFTSISIDALTERYPWKDFVHDTHEFLFQSSYVLPKTGLFLQSRSFGDLGADRSPIAAYSIESNNNAKLYVSNQGTIQQDFDKQNLMQVAMKREESSFDVLEQNHSHVEDPTDSCRHKAKKRKHSKTTIIEQRDFTTIIERRGSITPNDGDGDQQDRLHFRDSIFTGSSDDPQPMLSPMQEPSSLAQNGIQRRGKMPWREEELEALSKGMHLFGTSWATILTHFGANGLINDVLKARNQIQLKDKARNEKSRRQKLGIPLDVFEKACD